MNAPITAEALLAKLKTLPPERLGQIADFVDFLATQEQRRQAGEELQVNGVNASPLFSIPVCVRDGPRAQ